MIRLDNTQYLHFLHRADALRRSGWMCDARISVKQQTFRAHRLVLACASKRLKEKLTQAETDQEVHCTLDDMSPRTFRQVLDFAYMKSVEVSQDDVQQLLLAAQFLEMQPLEEQCRRHLDARRQRTRERDEEEEAKKKGNEEEEELQETRASKNDPLEKKPAEEPGKKSRLTPFSRGSVITSSPSNWSSSSAWTFPSRTWSSVSSLGRIADSYSTLNQPPAANAVAFPVWPPQGAHFQSPTQRRVVARWRPQYGQRLCSAAADVKTGLRTTTIKARQKADKTSEIRSPDVHKADPVKECKNCSLCRDPGEACARCRLFATNCESQTDGHDLKGARPYQCQRCPKRFSLKHQLDTHHRIHTGEKPFECRLCGQRSRDFSAIIKHLRTHGGASPYRCTLCLEFCSSLVAMQRHVKSHPAHDFPPDWSISSTYLYTSHMTQH
ncbi:uncharacterized protein zbtb32 [Festucalex cinctus]